MKTDYADKKFLRRMQRENKLEELSKSVQKAVPYVLGAVAGVGLIYGLTFLSSKTIKPYTDKAAYQIEQKASYEKKPDSFVYNSGAKRR